MRRVIFSLDWSTYFSHGPTPQASTGLVSSGQGLSKGREGVGLSSAFSRMALFLVCGATDVKLKLVAAEQGSVRYVRG